MRLRSWVLAEHVTNHAFQYSNDMFLHKVAYNGLISFPEHKCDISNLLEAAIQGDQVKKAYLRLLDRVNSNPAYCLKQCCKYIATEFSYL